MLGAFREYSIAFPVGNTLLFLTHECLHHLAFQSLASHTLHLTIL